MLKSFTALIKWSPNYIDKVSQEKCLSTFTKAYLELGFGLLLNLNY